MRPGLASGRPPTFRPAANPSRPPAGGCLPLLRPGDRALSREQAPRRSPGTTASG